MSAIWLQYRVIGGKEGIKLAVDLFDQNMLRIFRRSPVKPHHHHHLAWYPMKKFVRCSHQLLGIKNHARIPPYPRCEFEVAKRYLPVDLEWAEAIATAVTIIAGISSK